MSRKRPKSLKHWQRRKREVQLRALMRPTRQQAHAMAVKEAKARGEEAASARRAEEAVTNRAQEAIRELDSEFAAICGRCARAE